MGRKPMTEEEKAEFKAKMEAAKAAKKAEAGETVEVSAENVTGVAANGSEIPLTELEPELKGQTVSAPATPEAEKKTYSAEEVQNMIDAAVAKAVQQTLSTQKTPTVVQVAAPDAERVQFLWQAPVGDENVFEVAQGLYGRIVGKTGTFSVPKNELSRAMDGLFRLLMDKRWIIAVSGLTDEEKQAYGVNYQPGEILDRGAFSRLVELGDELCDIYPKLCEGHREIVAKRVAEAYHGGSQYVTRERVMRLREICRSLGDNDAAFVSIIEEMNAADVK